MIKTNKITVNDIEDQWERFKLLTVASPWKGLDKVLVIVGSDRRGRAYGVFELSKRMGVSPWYWWADVPIAKQSKVVLKNLNYTSKAPSVKYRGVFLNDEDWALKPWASKLMDSEIGDIGPNTYVKVCELLLRLKANMLAPAMHEVTGAFYKYPENKIVTDRYGILMTTSHAEPLLYNNTTEWDKQKNGEWDYVTNKDGVLAVMDARVKEAAPFENIYTVGMRGIDDTGMKEVPDGYTKAGVLEQVIREERNILQKHIKKEPEAIPQIFVPYKEVLDIYKSGMQLPEDVTIVWPGDNYGYIKKLSNPTEAKRKGGIGVYYHISYLGSPNDYLWLNTTPPALMVEEMGKAYQTGADTYWLLNVGDIKPGELGMQFFLDMAWDVSAFDFGNSNDKIPAYLSALFGARYQEDFKQIFTEYFNLGFERKPEYMAWDWRWNSLDAKENIRDTEFSFQNYNEAETRLKRYNSISEKAKSIYKTLPKELKSAYYQLVLYPVVGAHLVNHKMLLAQKNRWYAQQGRAATNCLVDTVKMYDDSLGLITKAYNNLSNGKWKGMMTAPDRLPELQMPPMETISLSEEPAFSLFIPNGNTKSGYHELPNFYRSTQKSYYITLYNKSKKAISWQVINVPKWVKISKTNGKAILEEQIVVTIDWNNIPDKPFLKGEIIFNIAGKEESVLLAVDNNKVPDDVLYVEDNGVVSINPAKFSRKEEKKGSKVAVIDGLGYLGTSVQLGSVTDKGWANTTVSYDFYAEKAGYVTVYNYALPVFGKDEDTGTRYGVQIDNSPIHWESTASEEYSFEWQSNVIRNAAINTSKIWLAKPGKHTLKLIGGNPGMVIQKAIIDFGGLQESYKGPAPTYRK